jgi:hypothetical protein
MAKKEDHLSNEVSVGVEVTPTGVQAKAKSRLISSIDRLVGSVFDRWSASNERVADWERTVGANERKLLNAAAAKAVVHIGESDTTAARLLEHHLGLEMSRQRNVEAVVREAIEDLRSSPPSSDQNATGAEQIAPEVVDRFGRYAEGALTDELRQRWGRVLAAEVRSPGTVSNKVMRVVDEMDAQTASLFERLCASRLGNVVPAVLQTLTVQEKARLVQAGLLMDDSGGLVLPFEKLEGAGGFRWRLVLNKYIAYFPELPDSDKLLADNEWLQMYDALNIVLHVLTPEGSAVASILPDGMGQAARALDKEFKKVHPDAGVVMRRAGAAA